MGTSRTRRRLRRSAGASSVRRRAGLARQVFRVTAREDGLPVLRLGHGDEGLLHFVRSTDARANI